VLTAIEYAYNIQYHVFTENQKREVIEHARQMVYQYADVFIQNNQWLELQGFIEQLMVIDVENFQLNWLYTRAQYHLGEFELAKNSIEPLLTAPNYTVKANALLTKIQAALRQPEGIQLTKQGEHFIVQASVNESFTVALMIDTGASISLLSEQAFAEVNQYTQVDYVKELTLSTAGGLVTASIYQAQSLSIQGYVVKDFLFAVSPLIGANNDGLLGMNYLRAFEFTIDQRHNLLILNNK
jgi:clan AA aspartic protease (TIGR02281 family)